MASKENPDFKLKDNPKKEFNKIRRILLRNIPPSTEGEIEKFLGKYKAEKIEISESLDSAIVTLKNGRQLEEAVTELDNKKLKDNDVTVTFCASDKLICVAHLPPTYSDEDLLKLLDEYGKLKTCFIVRSEKTGHSKSYALLEFEEQNLEKVSKIRDELDWKDVGSHLLHTDFIEPSYQTWERLQSRCLAVSGLPKDFTETNKLREMFSVVTSPVYCQIVMIEKESLGMGIVEFRKPEEAEETWEKVRDNKIEDKEITVTFCIPSKPAVVINNRIMWKFSDKVQKSSLLPDPVAAKPVISNNAIVVSLVKQNPNLVEDFTKVLAEFHQAYVNHMMSPGNKPGLLGPAPTLPMSPMNNPHLQMGLIIMLVLHIHAEKKEPFTGLLAKQLNTLIESPTSAQSTEAGPGKKPSILGDPMTAQANIVLCNLKKQLNQVEVTEEDMRTVTSSSPAVRSVMAKFMQNARYLNLNLLVNLGQMVMNMQGNAQPETPLAQAAAAAASSLARHSMPGQPLLNPPGSGKGLLGDVPRPSPNANPATMRFMKTLEAVASQKLGGQNRGLLSAIMTNINVTPTINRLEKKSSLLGEPPQHLRGGPKDQGSGSGGFGPRSGMGSGSGNMGKMGGGNMGMGGGNMGMGGGNMGMGGGNMGMGGGNMGMGGGNMGMGGGNMGMGGGNMGMGGGNMGMSGGNMGMGGNNMGMGGGMGMSGGNMGMGSGNMGMGGSNMGGRGMSGMDMGGGMDNMGGGVGNMSGGMGNMSGGMGNMSGGGMSSMGGGMSNMSGGMGNMGGSMGSSMGDMGQQNKQSWGSGTSQGARGTSANTGTASKTDSYSTFGNYSGGYGDMSAYGSGYTEEYSQFNQGDYNSGGYGDSTMYGGDQTGYQYSDYSQNYGTGQDSYNFQSSNNYSGNFGDYTGGYSTANTGNTGYNYSQSQSGNVQDGARYGGGGGSWGTSGASSAGGTTAGVGMGGGMQNVGVSKNYSGGGAGPGGGTGMGGQGGAGAGYGSASSGGAQAGYGSGKGLLGTPRGSQGGSTGSMGGSYGAQAQSSNMGRTATDSYQTSGGQGYMNSSTGTMGSYSTYDSTSGMDGYNTGSYTDASATGGYDAYSMGDYSNSYNQTSYNSGSMNQMTPAGSKRGYGHLKTDAGLQGDYSGQQSLANQYDKRPRLY